MKMVVTKLKKLGCPSPEISPKTTMRTPAKRSTFVPVEPGGSISIGVGSGLAGGGGRGFPQAHVSTSPGLSFPQEGHVRRIIAEQEGRRSASSATGALQYAQFTNGSSSGRRQLSTVN